MLKLDEILTDSPLHFAASLERPHIEIIADILTNELVDGYAGRLIGPRPRFSALATYWPLLCDPREAGEGGGDCVRSLSVKAVQTSLCLASCLGCRHVEIVGGASLVYQPSRPSSAELTTGFETTSEIEKRWRGERMRRLAESLCEVYENPRAKSLGLELSSASEAGSVPYVCIEVEPGDGFLINDLRSFDALQSEVRRRQNVDTVSRVLLNIDIAHMFLVDAAANADDAAMTQLDVLLDRHLELCVGHCHISDHSRAHAADVCPGTYHSYGDYRGWLQLLVKLRSAASSPYSGFVSVEMEGCGDIHEAVRAVGRTRRWLRQAGSDLRADQMDGDRSIGAPSGTVAGVVMVVDIANSTNILGLGGMESEIGSANIEAAVSSLCGVVHRCRGAVYSFTGDGFVAVFDQRHHASEQACSQAAYKAARQLYEHMARDLSEIGRFGERERSELALRIALHRGCVEIPIEGHLRSQVIGRDVIIACRVCGSMDRLFDGGQGCAGPPRSRVAVTEEVFLQVAEGDHDWVPLPDRFSFDNPKSSGLARELKGIDYTMIRERIGSLHAKTIVPPSQSGGSE